jgi:hypothetical protein
MWRGPRSEAARRAEIGRLEQKRDNILDQAPHGFFMMRLVSPLMLAASLLVLVRILVDDPLERVWGSLFMLGFVALCSRLVWLAWIKPAPRPGDLWGFSDRLGYEGDSPREVQQKIDRLRSIKFAEPPR